jgi:transcriptional regulator with XRE-family HTH domain
MANLQSLLRDRGIRQSELAGHLDVSEPSVSRWANGAADIPARYIQPIASFIGVPVADVVAVAVRVGAPEAAG